jgi:hypothetical protein
VKYETGAIKSESQQKQFVIGDWLLVICHFSLAAESSWPFRPA